MHSSLVSLRMISGSISATAYDIVSGCDLFKIKAEIRQWYSFIVIPSKLEALCGREGKTRAARDLGEPREVSRSLRHNNRAFGSLPY